MTGLNRFNDKKKREMRRMNHIARDLRTPKYKQRRVDHKAPPQEKKITIGSREWYEQFDEVQDVD